MAWFRSVVGCRLRIRERLNVAKLLTVEGLRGVEKTLGVLAPRESRNLSRRVVVKIAALVRNDVRAAAREVVTRRSGRLFKAIRSKRERGRPDVFEASVTIHLKAGGAPTAPHWHLIEFGTVNQKPRPFIAPTVKEWEPQLTRFYREEFGRQLERQLAKREKSR